jgi:RNA polymerase sigma-70 factor (sigma-E family)
VSVESDEEFRDFMRGRWSAMVRLAYTLAGDQGHAEDITQAAFARVYASWGRVSRASDPEAYVRTIVIRENSKRFRRQRVREDLRAVVPEQTLDLIDGVVDGVAERAALQDALNLLGPRQRAVIVLRFWLDMSEAMTAQTLNCSVGTVKSQTSRALAILRKHTKITEGELR